MKKHISNILITASILLIVIPKIRDRKDIEQSIQEVQAYEEEIESNENFEGSILRINSIDLNLPIKHGAEHKNMISSVATMTNERVQDHRNFTIAGHRNLRYGKNFNRLDELDVGNTIQVQDKQGIHEFEIEEKRIVKPEEVEVLNDTGKTEVTLVTCHPPGISTHRLIIKGRKVN